MTSNAVLLEFRSRKLHDIPDFTADKQAARAGCLNFAADGQKIKCRLKMVEIGADGTCPVC